MRTSEIKVEVLGVRLFSLVRSVRVERNEPVRNARGQWASRNDIVDAIVVPAGKRNGNPFKGNGGAR